MKFTETLEYEGQLYIELCIGLLQTTGIIMM